MEKALKNYGVQGKILAEVKSSSEPDKTYTISETEKGIACTCIGYATSKKRPRGCRHIKRYYLTNILESIVARSVGEQNTISQAELEHEADEIERLYRKED